MAYDWIRVSVKTTRHPKIQRLEKALGIEDGLGCAVRLWAWAAEFCPEGEFPADSAAAVGRAVAGDLPSLRNVTPEKVTEALVTVGLIDVYGDRYEVHDWTEYQAAHADRAERDRELNRERQRRFRNRRRNAPVTRDGNAASRVIRNDEPLPRGEERTLETLSLSPREQGAAARLAILARNPLTDDLLAELGRRGFDAFPPAKLTAAQALERALSVVSVPVAADRVMSLVEADRALGVVTRPHLGWHLDAISGRSEGGRRPKQSNPQTGVAAPADAAAFGEGGVRVIE